MMHHAVCPSETHEAMKLDDATWGALEYRGIQDGCGGRDLELRNCPCGSTLARPVAELCPCPAAAGDEVH